MESTYLKPSDYLNCQPWEKNHGGGGGGGLFMVGVGGGGLVQLASAFLHMRSVR